MESIDKLLPKKLQQGAVAKSIRAAVVLEKTNIMFMEMFGVEAGVIRAIVFKNGTITVRCEDSVHAQEVHLRESEILDRVAEILGERMVERLRVVS